MATVIWYLTPESPRWLLETDQHEESEKVLRQIARQNGQDLEKSDFSSKFAELTSRHASAPHGWPLLDVAALGLGNFQPSKVMTVENEGILAITRSLAIICNRLEVPNR